MVVVSVWHKQHSRAGPKDRSRVPASQHVSGLRARCVVRSNVATISHPGLEAQLHGGSTVTTVDLTRSQVTLCLIPMSLREVGSKQNGPPKLCPYPNLQILKCGLTRQTSDYLYGKRS